MRNAVLAAMAALAVFLSGAAAAAWEQRIDRPDHDIVIVYTNDVHCGVDENIGYAGLASFRNEMLKQTPYVALVDCGDAVQGEVIGAVSSGDYIIDIMNAVSYDIAICGNHEFDYGIPRLAYLIGKSNAQYLGANIHWLGGGKSPLPTIKPHKIMTFGPTKVAFIGVSTPESITSSTPKFFMRDGEYVWTFRGDSPKAFYEDIQRSVEECRLSGADYVILMSHVGDGDVFGPFASPEIAKHTRGIDAIIDGHQHSVIPSRYERSPINALVPVSSTGTKLANIGRVIITPDGHVTAGLINVWHERDPQVEAKIEAIKAEYTEALSQVAAHTTSPLPDGDGKVRTIRSRETPLGNLVADAYRAAGGADIGLAGGGCIRKPLPAGDITLADAINVNPFGNSLMVVKAKGQQVLDALEWGAQYVESRYSDGTNAVGEFGGFLHCSNLRYTIDTSVPSSVTRDANGVFTGVAGARRVRDAEVLRANGWEPIDPKAEYSVASISYLLANSGDGNAAFAGSEVLADNVAADYMAVIEYIRDVLGGDLSAYAAPEGRITVK